MKSRSRENFVHGTPSLEDAENIQEKGFETKEGRATVSGDLIYAFEWATNQEKRKGSQSETKIKEGEKGRMIIMKVPDDKSVDYATHTGIDVNESSKEITGYPSKYESGRKQLAIYDEGDIIEKREKIEQAKKELKEINSQFSEFLRENNIDPGQIRSKKDLIEATKSFDVEKTIEILKRAGELDWQRTEKRKEAEPGTLISKENILMSVVPTPELSERLDELQRKLMKLSNLNKPEILDLKDLKGVVSKWAVYFDKDISDPNKIISRKELIKAIIKNLDTGSELSEDIKNQITGDIKNKIAEKGGDLADFKVNLENFTGEVSKIIENNKENFLSSGSDVREIVGNLLASTLKTEVVNMVRSLSMDVKSAQGYAIYNRGKDEVKDKTIDKEQLLEKLKNIQLIVGNENFDMGMESLNRYIKISADKLLKELNS